MTPVVASVDGREWPTTVWRDKNPTQPAACAQEKCAAKKGDGDTVEIVLRIDRNRKAKRR